ncbi:6-phosphofructokinase [bacterium]|nr:6-phosphofructokinase [bacterium]
MKRVGLLTSGGDAPGMNACIRSVVRVGLARGLEIVGIRRGYVGLLANDFLGMGPRDVSNIIQRGGTILKTGRSEEFRTADGVCQAARILTDRRCDGLILIGGDGTFHGGVELGRIWPGQIIGLPGTIDNDLSGTDFTIGFDTATNTALEAIDKIRDTAESHDRIFVVEVMGRHAGYLAHDVGLAAGAEEIVVPERPHSIEGICARIRAGRERGKASSIIVVAEGRETGGAARVAQELRIHSGFEIRVVILGYIQRGGSPTARDRLLATRLGAHAVQVFLEGVTGVMVGEIGGRLVTTPLAQTWETRKPLDVMGNELQPMLAT